MATRRGSSAGAPSLFAHAAATRHDGGAQPAVPLAERMRPTTLADYMGQAHIVGEGKMLRRAITEDRVPSMILWGPPGVGKTTLGRVLAEQTKAVFVPFSAVLGSLPELREIVAAAKERREYKGERTLVFVDEIHRFNKGQQDAFLPHVEAGTITLVGATTENPSFSVNAALLSRCKVFRLEALADADLVSLLRRALADERRGLGASHVEADDEVLLVIAKLAAGDARRALGTLENLVVDAEKRGLEVLTKEAIAEADERAPLLYDKAGDQHYDVVSAFIKSLRGSDPDAAVYWMMRMLEAGEDPLFVLRRMMIFASEDVGLADSRALMVVTSADAAFRRMGMPEGMYPLAHAATYLACTPKSNAIKEAWHRAKAAIEEHGALPVPHKLRNAPTRLMKEQGFGANYKYPHDYEGNVAPGETYLPDALQGARFYEPSMNGEEARITKRLDELRGPRREP